ncbi:MAG: electron transfer flavoprotein subunit alpha/FixB family protein, partial [Spirochaetaceae bacterium]|nr:electron transfer flavoprotein subunit alpha/FixB family protein [Spirochaetaceae bacterium]
QADTVIVIDDPALENFVDEIQAKALCRLIDKYKPEIVICGATTRGRALIPRVAVMIRAGLTADCTGLEIEPESGLLLQTRPAFGGNIMATIKCENYRPQMSTVRPRVMTAPEPDPSRKGEIIKEDLENTERKARMRVLEVVGDSSQAVRLSDAKFIVTGGRGMKGPLNFQLLHDFAKRVGGAVGASRAAVDAGWIPYAHQVGQTGQTVQAKVYMACGVSGQIQHLVGMQSCDYIIAINKDPDAPMMQLADVAIVGDLFEVIPKLIAELPRT